MTDLILKYLNKHYLENNEEERADRYHDETKDVTDEAARLDKSPKNIQENISLLKEMVDRHAKELTELNKRLGSLAKWFRHIDINTTISDFFKSTNLEYLASTSWKKCCLKFLL